MNETTNQPIESHRRVQTEKVPSERPLTVSPSRATTLDTLLPPGADATLQSNVTAGTEVRLPEAPRKPMPARVPTGAAVVPIPDGGYATLRKKAKTIGRGENEVELKELTAEEKARKRFRYNLAMWSFCFLILFVVFLVLAWPAISK